MASVCSMKWTTGICRWLRLFQRLELFLRKMTSYLQNKCWIDKDSPGSNFCSLKTIVLNIFNMWCLLLKIINEVENLPFKRSWMKTIYNAKPVNYNSGCCRALFRSLNLTKPWQGIHECENNGWFGSFIHISGSIIIGYIFVTLRISTLLIFHRVSLFCTLCVWHPDVLALLFNLSLVIHFGRKLLLDAR